MLKCTVKSQLSNSVSVRIHRHTHTESVRIQIGWEIKYARIHTKGTTLHYLNQNIPGRSTASSRSLLYLCWSRDATPRSSRLQTCGAADEWGRRDGWCAPLLLARRRRPARWAVAACCARLGFFPSGEGRVPPGPTWSNCSFWAEPALLSPPDVPSEPTPTETETK
jgi:hypothetical protein